MLKLLKLFAWLVFSLALLVGFDQLLVRVPLAVPGVAQVQTFYVDFRGRMLGLIGIDGVAELPAKSIDQVIETTREVAAGKAQVPQRYLYVDDSGALQFADSLERVPLKFRGSAQPLAE